MNDGEGSIPVTGAIGGAGLEIGGGIAGVEAVGRFTNCAGPTEYLVVTGAELVVLGTDGLLATAGAQTTLGGFDPCEPWILQLGWTAYGQRSIKAWQATEPEPEVGLVVDQVYYPQSGPDTLRLFTLPVFGAGENDAVLIDLLNVDVEGQT